MQHNVLRQQIRVRASHNQRLHIHAEDFAHDIDRLAQNVVRLRAFHQEGITLSSPAQATQLALRVHAVAHSTH